MATDITNWSTTAGSNTSLGGVSVAEGMAPSLVNNAIRQAMAEIREWFADAQWSDLGDTPTYSDADTFTIAGDVTTTYTPGRRVKFTDSSTLYGTIKASSFSSPNTTIDVVLDSGSLSGSLSAVFVSILSHDNIAVPGYPAKAWAKVTTPTTVAAGEGVASVADGGSSDFTVTWDVPFASADYCVTVNSSLGGTSSTPLDCSITQLAASATVTFARADTQAAEDPTTFYIVAYGDV